jgi:hypothetical protein
MGWEVREQLEMWAKMRKPRATVARGFRALHFELKGLLRKKSVNQTEAILPEATIATSGRSRMKRLR